MAKMTYSIVSSNERFAIAPGGILTRYVLESGDIGSCNVRIAKFEVLVVTSVCSIGKSEKRRESALLVFHTSSR